MPKLATILIALAALLPRAAGAADSFDFSGTTPGPVRIRDDAVRIVLTEASARRLGATGAAPRAVAAPLGLAGLDHEAISLGAVLEREFPDLPVSRTGGIDLSRHWIARFPPAVGRERALASLRSAPEVESAGPIAIVPVVRVPDDSLWSWSYFWFQSSRRDVHAPEAWDVTTGGGVGPVAVLDTGVLPWHPDLGGTVAGSRGNLWVNAIEAAGAPGVDDDGNGYLDDVSGWDFVNLLSDTLVQPREDWRDEDNDPNDYAGHGTAVAGVIAALTDNRIGVAGAAWDARILPLRIGWSGALAASGEVDLSYAARAIVYAAVAGAEAINLSFATVAQEDLALAMDVATRLGSTLVVAAGNNGSPHAMSSRADVLSVAATDADDKVARFSNRGDYVDVAAPGQFIATTSIAKDFLAADSVGLRQPDYTRGASGTSFSAPIAAGAVALLQARQRELGRPRLHPRDVLLRLVDTADDISEANPGVTGYGSGRLNFHRALTDPPTSFTIACRAIARGAPAVLPTLSGAGRVAFAATDGRLVIADATGATVLTAGLPAAPAGGLAAADLGNGAGPGLFVPLVNGTIAGCDETGAALPGWPVAATGVSGVASAAPALADVDGDGGTDVVWGGIDGAVHAWHADGTRFSGFPVTVGAAGANVLIALAELDGRAGDEIVAATSTGGVTVLGADGTTLPGWPRSTAPLPLPPVVTTLGADPEPCIFVAAASIVTAFRADGSTRWRRSVPGLAAGSPAAGDLDGDGRDELVFATTPNLVTVLDSAGVIVHALAGAPVSAGPGMAVAPAVVTLAGGRRAVLLSAAGSVAAWDASGATVPGFPRAGAGAPAVADLDGDGRAEIVIAANPDSVGVVYDAGPGSWNPAHRGWPTDRGGAARRGSHLAPSRPAVLDDVPPATVRDLAGAGTQDGALLSWTAPGDAGSPAGRAHRYDLRRSSAPIGDGNFDAATPVAAVPVPAAAGARQNAIVSGLEEERTYWFALRSADRAGNLSALSNVASATVPAVPPAAVDDLEIAGATDTSLVLGWTATGDDGRMGRPERYRIHVAEAAPGAPVGEAVGRDLEQPATSDAGGGETAVVGGLRSDRRYWVTVYAEDDGGRWSAGSNVVSGRPGPLAVRTGFAVLPSVQPARPPVALHWQIGSLVAGNPVRLDIVDIAGRRLRTLALGAGREGVVAWDGHDDSGRRVPNGVYFMRLAAGPRQRATRLVVLW